MIGRAVLVWLVLIGAEFIHGILRTLFLAPYTGDFRARQIGVFTGSCLIVGVAYLLVRWLRVRNAKSLLFVGLLWLVLTVGFELGFGHFVVGRSWEDLACDYNLARGGLLPIGLLVLTLSPMIVARLRDGRPVQ
jgi:hypothetical protein